MNKDFALPSSQCLQNLHSMVVLGWPTITYLPQYHSFDISPIDTPSFHEGMKYSDMPPGHQPATPRFLLSLLVIVIYLSIQRIASQAVGSILKIIGPHTVMSCLNFALRKPVDTFESSGTKGGCWAGASCSNGV